MIVGSGMRISAPDDVANRCSFGDCRRTVDGQAKGEVVGRSTAIMAGTDAHVEGIDHVELVVPDRDEAARWYERVLGLTVCAEYAFWAEEGGPLMISSDDGWTKLALFEGDHRTAPVPKRVAFRINGDGFLCFLARLPELDLVDGDDRRVTEADIVDHDVSVSLYFRDPYGTPLEVTTYDYEAVMAKELDADSSTES